MFRLVLIFFNIFGWCFIAYSIIDAVNEINFQKVLIISCVLTAFYYLCEILKIVSGIPKKYETCRGRKYNLISFDDAIADEIMRVRKNQINFKLMQDKFNQINMPLGMDNAPDIFLRLYWLYLDYPYNAICKQYETPMGDWGLMIMVFDKIYFDDTETKFDARELRKINSSKHHKFTKGIDLSVYIYEPELYKPQIRFFDTTDFERTAKILSIEGDTWEDSLNVTLEIKELNLDGEQFGEAIIRKIDVNSYPEHFIPDKKRPS